MNELLQKIKEAFKSCPMWRSIPVVEYATLEELAIEAFTALWTGEYAIHDINANKNIEMGQDRAEYFAEYMITDLIYSHKHDEKFESVESVVTYIREYYDDVDPLWLANRRRSKKVSKIDLQIDAMQAFELLGKCTKAEATSVIVSLEKERSNILDDAYDAGFARANEDMTGQDLDRFVSEHN